MPRLTARDFAPGLLEVFNEYVHGRIDRRGFLDRARKYAVGGTTAAMLLEMLRPRFAEAQQVPKDDKRLVAQYLEFPSPKGSEKTRGYLVRPAGVAARLPAILVIHENRGLNPHIEDIARRVALGGYLAFAPDALAAVGGYPGDEEAAAKLFGTLDMKKIREDFVAAAEFLQGRADCTGRFGVVGFCFGGSIANHLATRLPDLAAAVPFYGGQPSAEDTARIKAALLIHNAENDNWVNKGWPAFEAALKANQVRYEMHLYPGTQHGFNNNTTPRYDEAAAKLAWQRTMSFLDKHLRGSVMSTSVPPAAVADLAPSGKLRAAINFGNAVLAQKDPATGEARGVSVDLARDLGRRLGVPVELVTFEAAGKVFEAAKDARWDIAFLAIDPARATEILFTPAYVQIEGTYIVANDSPFRAMDDLDREGVRIVVAKGSAYDLHLSRTIKKATLVRVATTPAVAPHFLKEKLEAGAGIRQGLERFAAANPGLRVIDGRFMVIEQAMGTLRGREAGGRYLRDFIEEMKASGFVARALAASGTEAAVARAAR